MQNFEEARAWVEVDTGALRANFETVRRVAGPSCGVIAMVKADAYGVGAERVARALEPLKPYAYGVAAAAEGAELRSFGITRPILVTTPLPPADVGLAAEAGLTPAISDLVALDRWADTGRGLDFHVEVDTGMGRAGFDWRETAQWSQAVAERSAATGLVWRGIYTHMHSADSADATPTRTQWQRFQDALAQLPVSRDDLVVHVANSAAALRWPEYAADAVRPGIFLYGGRAADPSFEPSAPEPMPVVSVRARVVLVREVPPGSTVGYGATHAARAWERWATLSIGYADGVPRILGNRGAVLLRGARAPMIGRTSMDMVVVDITGLPPVREGDVATLIGRDAGAQITLDEVAEQAGTISYEILTGLGQRLPRVEWNSNAET